MRQPVHRWVEDEAFDIDYHVRHSALPAPGGERELGILVSRLHSNQLDFRRPPWEMHVIEGLAGGASPSTRRSTTRSSTATPGCGSSSGGCRATPTTASTRSSSAPASRRGPEGAPREADPVGDVASILRSLAVVGRGHARRCSRRSSRPSCGAGTRRPRRSRATRPPTRSSTRAPGGPGASPPRSTTWRRLRAIAQGAATPPSTTCSWRSARAACARWLADQDALPERPLIAFIPVNVRPKESEGGGNAVGATLVSLATDVEDPLPGSPRSRRPHGRRRRGCGG